LRFKSVFCLAVAVIAAAIADPIVEFASNAGWFGAGSFTDHSNLDIIPALLAGVGLLAIYMVRKAAAIVSNRIRPSDIVPLLPPIFVLQIVALYVMESVEQLVVWRHTLGPMVWVGGPLFISLAVHAAICLLLTFAVVRSKRRLAEGTLRAIQLISAFIRVRCSSGSARTIPRHQHVRFKELSAIRYAVGERAPPLPV